MTILDNYMLRPLLAIFRLSLRELKFLLYNVRARDGEISTSGLTITQPGCRDHARAHYILGP